MKRTAATIAAALTTLALAGCSTDTETETAAAEPTTTGTEQAAPNNSRAAETDDATPSAPNVETDGPRAAEKLDQFMAELTSTYQSFCEIELETLADYRECTPGDPLAYLDAVESPAPGELIVTLKPAAWGGGEYDPDQVYTLQYVAQNMSVIIGHATDDLQQLTTTTPDGSHQHTWGRSPQVSKHDPAGQAWADEMIDRWLEEEGVESVNGLLDPFNLIQSWEATGSGELTIYTDPAVMNDSTHTEAGPGVLYGITALVWQRLYCWAPQLDAVTVTTTDGQHSTTTDHEEWGTVHETNTGKYCRN